MELPLFWVFLHRHRIRAGDRQAVLSHRTGAGPAQGPPGYRTDVASCTPNDLADDLLAVHAERGPIGASLAGLAGYDDRLPDPAEIAEQALASRVARIAGRARRLDPGTLNATDRVTLAVVIHTAGSLTDTISAGLLEHTVSDTFTSPAHNLLVSLPLVSVSGTGQADAYLRRLGDVPRYLRAVADRHRAGLAAGRSPVARLVAATVGRLDRYLADDDGDPLRRPGSDISTLGNFADRRDRLLAEVVHPAVAGYRRMLADELAGRSRPPERCGLCWVPGGEAAYAALVRAQTSAGREPEDLHRTGLKLMAGLAEEYAGLGARVLGTSEVPSVLDRLRHDPGLCWIEPAEILAASRGAVHRADAAAPGWFGRLAARRCEVRAVPDADTSSVGSAYYTAAPLDGTRPGIFFVNTSHPARRPRHTAEAVAFHEAVPGHHLQLALAQELTDLPLLRRLATINAYVEGWALYAERLADEIGLYSSDLARLGMVTEDSCRAGRSLSTPACTHAAGPASAPSTTCATTPRWRTSKSSTRSTATSPSPHRRCPT